MIDKSDQVVDQFSNKENAIDWENSVVIYKNKDTLDVN